MINRGRGGGTSFTSTPLPSLTLLFPIILLFLGPKVPKNRTGSPPGWRDKGWKTEAAQ